MCQRAAPHRTNDVDSDQRRRTLDGLPNPDPLTRSAIEGSQERKLSCQVLGSRWASPISVPLDPPGHGGSGSAPVVRLPAIRFVNRQTAEPIAATSGCPKRGLRRTLPARLGSEVVPGLVELEWRSPA